MCVARVRTQCSFASADDSDLQSTLSVPAIALASEHKMFLTLITSSATLLLEVTISIANSGIIPQYNVSLDGRK
jgi:hypothetical protein